MTCATSLIPTLLVAAGFVLACSAEPSPVPYKSEVSRIDVGVREAGPVAQDGVPAIRSDAAVHEFGAIKATDSVEHIFKIRNVGTADLEIERVQRT